MNFTLKNRLRFLPETVIVSIIAVPLILTEKSTHFMYNHTCRMGNGSGSRRRLLNSVQAALKSPFSKSIHTAIPPPAALCDISEVLTPLSHRFVVVGTYHNAAEWICQPLFSDNLQSVRQGSATKQNPTVLGPISRHSPVYVTG